MTQTAGPSKLATAAVLIAAVAISLPGLGVLGIHLGALSPMAGFGLFAAGCVLGGLLALLLGIAGIVTTRGGGDPEGRKRAWIAVAGGVALLGALALAGNPGRGLPRINDITTDTADPPAFFADPAERGRDMAYPPDFVPQVLAAYPDLETRTVPYAPSEAFDRAARTAEELGWEVTRRDEGRGLLEASETTAIFQFVDDVVVRIRPATSGAELDIRSKSRDGQGDVGANAARIRRFLDAYGD